MAPKFEDTACMKCLNSSHCGHTAMVSRCKEFTPFWSVKQHNAPTPNVRIEEYRETRVRNPMIPLPDIEDFFKDLERCG